MVIVWGIDWVGCFLVAGRGMAEAGKPVRKPLQDPGTMPCSLRPWR